MERSGRVDIVLDLRSGGWWFETRKRRCIVSLNTTLHPHCSSPPSCEWVPAINRETWNGCQCVYMCINILKGTTLNIILARACFKMIFRSRFKNLIFFYTSAIMDLGLLYFNKSVGFGDCWLSGSREDVCKSSWTDDWQKVVPNNSSLELNGSTRIYPGIIL